MSPYTAIYDSQHLFLLFFDSPLYQLNFIVKGVVYLLSAIYSCRAEKGR